MHSFGASSTHTAGKGAKSYQCSQETCSGNVGISRECEYLEGNYPSGRFAKFPFETAIKDELVEFVDDYTETS